MSIKGRVDKLEAKRPLRDNSHLTQDEIDSAIQRVLDRIATRLPSPYPDELLSALDPLELGVLGHRDGPACSPAAKKRISKFCNLPGQTGAFLRMAAKAVSGAENSKWDS